jgi:DNA polymerase-3 subunit epsilon
MKLRRALAVMDCESTGTDPMVDRIVSFAVTVLNPDGTRTSWKCLVNPGCPIPAEATAVHGITDADVADCPPFSAFALKIWKGLNGKDLAGFNLRRFDVPLLDEELRRCGLCLDLRDALVIDCGAIFFKKNPRTLADAVRFYCGREPSGAHDASCDADDTLDVLLGQLSKHEDLEAMELSELAAYSNMADLDYADIAQKLYRSPEGLRFAFGKNKDKRVLDEPSYVDWMINKASFPGSTVDALNEELSRG